MEILQFLFLKNINLLFAIIGLIFSLIFVKKISKQSSKLFFLIISLCILLAISSQYEEYISNLADFDLYNHYGGDIARTTLSIINYVLRPTIILLFIEIIEKSKWTPILWAFVGLTVPIYTTSYYSDLSFNIINNSFHGGSIPFFRFYSPMLCFLLIGYFILITILNFRKKRSKGLILNIITIVFAIIVSVVEFIVGGNMLTLTIIIALILYFIYIYDLIVNKKEEELIKANNIDVLTDLGNERAYYTYLEEIDKRKGNDAKKRYAIMLMDLNGLKTTDDTYGHRFGCHLIVEFGHQLPEFFKTSKLFHIGGDEFVAILEGEDFRNRNKLLEKFIEKYSFSEIEFEGKKLILSVAIGMQENEKDKKYNEIFQVADKNMYANKSMIKKKYRIKSRIEED